MCLLTASSSFCHRSRDLRHYGKKRAFGAAFYEWDFSVSKRWRFRDRVGVQFRAEFFNFLNNRTYAGFGGITNAATFGLATSAPNASNPINVTGGPREVQLGLKATFRAGLTPGT
jgi:hypothetical protein